MVQVALYYSACLTTSDLFALRSRNVKHDFPCIAEMGLVGRSCDICAGVFFVFTKTYDSHLLKNIN